MKYLLFMSTILALSSSSWAMIWVCLEINAMSMCYIMDYENKKNKKSHQNIMIYFLVQMMGSIIVLLSSTMETEWSQFSIMLALMMKMGGWPSHLWYMKMIDSMELSKELMILMTWQKIIPCWLMMFSNQWVMLVSLSILAMLTPMNSLSANKSLKSILGLSSLNNNGWLILCMCMGPSTFFPFLSLYSMGLWSAMKYFKQNKKKNHWKSKEFWMSCYILINMSGLPPLIMFSGKVLAISGIFSLTKSQPLALLMMIMACFFLYHYLWSVLTFLMQSPIKTQNSMKKYKGVPLLMSTLVCSLVALNFCVM
nr:NADH dehydrogenase subunit 2 [Lardoglyphus konoi]